MSPKSTSAMPPSETMWEKPICRAVAQSSTEVRIAPDWLTKARSPEQRLRLREARVESVAGTMMPRQFGPTMRSV